MTLGLLGEINGSASHRNELLLLAQALALLLSESRFLPTKKQKFEQSGFVDVMYFMLFHCTKGIYLMDV